jgi:formyl-CoA transferase
MDLTIQAISGAMATTGFPDGPPVRTGPAVVDFLGGAHLAAAVLGALVQRGVTGRGQHVEVALYDAIFPSLASNIAAHFDTDGELPDRTGNRHGGMAVSPYNAYPTTNGWIAILCLHDRHWETLCRVMGREELTVEPSFATNPARVLYMDDVDAIVSSWTATRTATQAVAELEAANVPCAPVKSLREVIDDPNVAQRGLLRQHLTGDREWWTLASPLRLEDSPSPAENVPPRLGQDTDHLLSERLGMSQDAIAALESAGIITRDIKSEVGTAGVR